MRRSYLFAGVGAFTAGLTCWAQVPADSPLRAAPQIRQAAGALPSPELICQPEYALFIGWTRQILTLHDGKTLVVSSPGENGGAYLYLINSDDLGVQRFSVPKHHGSASNAVVGRDGHIYLPPHTNGCIYRFDTKTHTLTRLDVGYPKKELTWGSVAASNGRIYFGSYPTATLGEFDPVTGKCEYWQHTVPDTKYAMYFSEDRKGRIRFLAVHPKNQWMRFDPETRKLEHGKRVGTPAKMCGPPFGLPPAPGGDTKFARCLRSHGRFFAISFPTGRFWEILAPEGGPGQGKPSLVLRGDTTCPVEKWKMADPGDAIVGVSDYGCLFRFDLATGRFVTGHLPNYTRHPSHVMYLETVSPRCVVLSPGIHKGFVVLDPQTGQFRQIYNMFDDKGVQGQCAVAAKGKLYMGLYGGAVLMCFDPSQPYEWARNPYELITLADQHAQTRPRQAISDGKRVFFCTDGAYGVLGGAIAVIDTATDAVEVYKHPIKDQNMPAIALAPDGQTLWGGTWRWGTSRSCPPTQPSSLLYAFDLRTGRTVHQQVLWPNSNNTYVGGISADGILVATNGAEIALVDTANRDVLYKGKMGVSPPARLRRGSDGLFYFIRDKRVWSWDLTKNVVTPLAEAEPCKLLTEASHGLWVLGGVSGIFKLDLTAGRSIRH